MIHSSFYGFFITSDVDSNVSGVCNQRERFYSTTTTVNTHQFTLHSPLTEL